MKAAILRGYDKNGCDLEIRDIPVPEISEKEVLVKIRTAGERSQRLRSRGSCIRKNAASEDRGICGICCN